MSVVKPNKRPKAFTKVSQKVIDNILKDISEGSTRKHASEANGITSRHFHYLVAQGLVDLEWGKTDSMFARMVRSLRAIEQEEIKWCRNAAKNSEDGHRGAQWTLEHAYWRYFGKDANAKELAEEIDRLREEMRQGVKKHGQAYPEEAKVDPEE
jgi:hypothetical protein